MRHSGSEEPRIQRTLIMRGTLQILSSNTPNFTVLTTLLNHFPPVTTDASSQWMDAPLRLVPVAIVRCRN